MLSQGYSYLHIRKVRLGYQVSFPPSFILNKIVEGFIDTRNNKKILIINRQRKKVFVHLPKKNIESYRDTI